MKKLSGAVLFLIATTLRVLAADPVGDYLSRFSPLGGDRTIYSSDRLLRLDLDLNGDGQREVLLSMARDRNAKQGNVWSIYNQSADGSAAMGTMTFNASRFYVGPIDELNRYGLVTFWPGGGDEGTLAGFLFDGATIREVQVASIVRDTASGEILGQDVLDKYMSKAVIGDSVTTSMGSDTLAKQYGVKIDQKTSRQVAEELLQSQQAQRSESAFVSPSAEATRDAQVAATSQTTPGTPQAESKAPGSVMESHKTRRLVVLRFDYYCACGDSDLLVQPQLKSVFRPGCFWECPQLRLRAIGGDLVSLAENRNSNRRKPRSPASLCRNSAGLVNCKMHVFEVRPVLSGFELRGVD